MVLVFLNPKPPTMCSCDEAQVVAHLITISRPSGGADEISCACLGLGTRWACDPDQAHQHERFLNKLTFFGGKHRNI